MVKKLAAVILVAMMVCSAWTGLAETDTRKELAEDLKEYAGNFLRDLQNYYNANPEKCGDEFIMLVHSYYEMYQVMSEVSMAEGQFSLVQNPLANGKSPMAGQAKEQAATKILVDKALLDMWELWLKGETESPKYLHRLMGMVEAAIKAMDATK